VAYKFGGFFHKAPTLYRYWETIIVCKYKKQGSLSGFMPLTGMGHAPILLKISAIIA